MHWIQHAFKFTCLAVGNCAYNYYMVRILPCLIMYECWFQESVFFHNTRKQWRNQPRRKANKFSYYYCLHPCKHFSLVKTSNLPWKTCFPDSIKRLKVSLVTKMRNSININVQHFILWHSELLQLQTMNSKRHVSDSHKHKLSLLAVMCNYPWIIQLSSPRLWPRSPSDWRYTSLVSMYSLLSVVSSIWLWGLSCGKRCTASLMLQNSPPICPWVCLF